MESLLLLLLSLLCIYVALLVMGFRRNPSWAAAALGWPIVTYLTAGLIVATMAESDSPAMEGMTAALLAIPFLAIMLIPAFILAVIAAVRRPGRQAEANGRRPVGDVDPRYEVLTDAGTKRLRDVAIGDVLVDPSGVPVTVVGEPELVGNELSVAVSTPSGRGIRRWIVG